MKEKTQRSREEYRVAVDVGGTKISSALFTSSGKMHARAKVVIDQSSPEKPADQIVSLIKSLQKKVPEESGGIRAAGIVIPGVVFAGRGLVWAPNISGWDHFPLVERIQQRIQLPLLLDSDRSAYVLGEQWCGVAKGRRNVVFLAVGTGIGAGILMDGKVCRGSEDISGAVGWFALNPRFQEKYAEMGCFEAEASGSSVARKAVQRLKTGERSIMGDLVHGEIDNITAETVVEAARRKDLLAKEVLHSAVQYLAMGIANIVSLLNPEMIVLGGGLFQAGEFLLEPVKSEFQKWAQPLAAQRVQIELSSLGEDAGLYGAGRLAWMRE